MTTNSLQEVLADTRTLLLDFDGPVCSIFAGYPASTIAAELRQLIADHGVEPPAPLRDEGDPLQILRASADLDGDALTRHLADALRNAEVTAADSAQPTPHAADVLIAARETGRRVGIVSNNSMDAIDRYLDRRALGSMIEGVAARHDGMDPRNLKPSPYLVELAMIGIGPPPWRTTLVGDSVTDIQAARAAGIYSIGYANKPAKRTALTEAGADAVIHTMADLAFGLHEALCQAP